MRAVVAPHLVLNAFRRDYAVDDQSVFSATKRGDLPDPQPMCAQRRHGDYIAILDEWVHAEASGGKSEVSITLNHRSQKLMHG